MKNLKKIEKIKKNEKLQSLSDGSVEKLLLRSTGKEIRENISENKMNIIDFKNVKYISNSFGDELFGILLLNKGEDFFKNNITIINANESILNSIKFCLSNRNIKNNKIKKQ